MLTGRQWGLRNTAQVALIWPKLRSRSAQRCGARSGSTTLARKRSHRRRSNAGPTKLRNVPQGTTSPSTSCRPESDAAGFKQVYHCVAERAAFGKMLERIGADDGISVQLPDALSELRRAQVA